MSPPDTGRGASPGRLSLLVDLGSSAVKARVVDDRDGSQPLAELSAPVPGRLPDRPAGRHESDPVAILSVIQEVMDQAVRSAGAPVTRVAVSAQMHSALVTDRHGRLLTPMISWQDDRLTEPAETEDTKLAALTASVPAALRRRAGIALRPGFGAGNVAVALSEQGLDGLDGSDGPARLHTLGSYLTTSLGGPYATHLSSAAALGLVDLDRGTWSHELAAAYGLGHLALPRIVSDYTPLGSVPLDGTTAELFPDLGDHQASVLGGGGLGQDELAISLGTAGIAARWSPRRADSDHVDSRPYPGGGYLLAVSRLPGGRLAKDLAGFIAAVGSSTASSQLVGTDIWARAATLAGPMSTSDRLRVSELPRPGGGQELVISGASGESDVVPALLHGLVDHYVERYHQAMRWLWPEDPLPRRARFNGGLAVRSPWFAEQFAARLGMEVVDYPDHDLALDGLRLLLQRHNSVRRDAT